MERRIPSPLTVRFTYTGTVADGDVLTIDADGTVRRLVDPSEPVIGQVYAFETVIKECTVVVPYNYHRDTRLAGETVVPGRFVWGPSNTVKQFTSASVARHDGTTTGPKTVTVDTDDTIKVTLENGADQTIVITAGVGLTFAAIAAEINATLTGMTVVVNTAGNLCLVANEIGKAITIGTVATDAYTLLGWTAATYAPSNPSHDVSAVGGLILTAGDAADAVGTLEN